MPAKARPTVRDMLKRSYPRPSLRSGSHESSVPLLPSGGRFNRPRSASSSTSELEGGNFGLSTAVSLQTPTSVPSATRRQETIKMTAIPVGKVSVPEQPPYWPRVEASLQDHKTTLMCQYQECSAEQVNILNFRSDYHGCEPGSPVSKYLTMIREECSEQSIQASQFPIYTDRARSAKTTSNVKSLKAVYTGWGEKLPQPQRIDFLLSSLRKQQEMQRAIIESTDKVSKLLQELTPPTSDAARRKKGPGLRKALDEDKKRYEAKAKDIEKAIKLVKGWRDKQNDFWSPSPAEFYQGGRV